MQTLSFYEKAVYGQDLIYPVKEIAEHIKALTGKKTVDKYNLNALKSLGFEIEINKANFELIYY
jgi:hypothetical protein